MKQNIDFYYKEKFLPTKRHRNLRERYVKNCMEVEVKELAEKEFPVAFIIHDYQSVYKNAKKYDDFNGNGEYKMFSEEIRTNDGKLYKPVRVTHGAAISTCFESLDYVRREISDYPPYYMGDKNFSEASIVKEDNKEYCEEKYRKRAGEYVIFDGIVWKECDEPMYMINTFGLGHNHGGTGFFIEYCYNGNIGRNNYFNALQREEAIAYGKRIATNRGDTKSVEGMGEHDIIEVLMPEMVKRNPQKEHGDGDSFMNSIESMISNTESSAEAGLLAMAMCMNEINKA